MSCSIFDKRTLNFVNPSSRTSDVLNLDLERFISLSRTFTEGGNFSRDEIEVHRKKLEKTIYQIDKAESAILKELEKLEKKQLEEATKIMSLFQER